MNALEQQLYPVEEFQLDTTRDVPYNKGISITLNNHKCSQYDLYTKLKDIYNSIYKALTDTTISKDNILTSRWKVPNRKTIMDMVIRDQPIMVAGIHKYNDIKHFDEYHLHMYVYGVHTYLQHEDGSIRFQKLGSYLKRYLNSRRKRTPSAVDIREVGINNYKFNDVITPATVYDYLRCLKPILKRIHGLITLQKLEEIHHIQHLITTFTKNSNHEIRSNLQNQK